MSLVPELLPGTIPQILINRERLPHKTFDIELLGNCDVIVKELCLRLAQSEPPFGEIKHLTISPPLNEVLYENLRSSVNSQPKKKVKLSPSTEDKASDGASELPKAERGLAALKDFNAEQSYISYRPRRYIFAGAEMNFSSDDESSSDDDDDEDQVPRKTKSGESALSPSC